MSDRYFVDTNIFLYAFDTTSTNKRERSHAIIRELFLNDTFCISTQVLNEFCSAAVKKLKPPLDVAEISRFISSFPSGIIESPGRNTVLHALEIQQSYRYSYYDSLIIATALEASCTVLYTEDMQHGQSIDELVITNPFKE